MMHAVGRFVYAIGNLRGQVIVGPVEHPEPHRGSESVRDVLVRAGHVGNREVAVLGRVGLLSTPPQRPAHRRGLNHAPCEDLAQICAVGSVLVGNPSKPRHAARR